MVSELKKPEPFDLAQLRHLYAQMVGGHVKDSAQAKRIAEGILGRAIEGLERRERQLEQYAADRVREALEKAARQIESGCPPLARRGNRIEIGHDARQAFADAIRTLKEQTK